MMMKRRFQVKMGAQQQQYIQTAGHPRDVQTRSDRELVFLLQKDPSQRTVHVSHFLVVVCIHGRPGFSTFHTRLTSVTDVIVDKRCCSHNVQHNGNVSAL